jgi:heavy metal translocating P-type ATPase
VQDSCPVDADPLACGCGTSEPIDLSMWWRVGVGAVIAANSMAVSLAFNISSSTESERRVAFTILLGLTVVSLVLLGLPLLKTAAAELRRGRITVEALFLAGVAGAFTASMVAVIQGTGDIYFEIVTILLVVYSFGRQISRHAEDRAVRAAASWAPTATTCRLVDESGEEQTLAVADVRAGDTLRVWPGEMVPVDGEVVDGVAFVREAEFTGELFATVKRPGSLVWAGTVCLDAGFTVRATADGTERRIDRIVDAVERARRVPSSLQGQADRIVRWFLPVLLTVAGGTFVGWTVARGWEVGLFNSMAVLLVACPCALGLATPVALWAAIGRLAASGLTVADGRAVEKLAAADTVVFDKTGTLTEARAHLVDMVTVSGDEHEGHRVRALVQAVETTSRHPVATAFHGITAGGGERLQVLDVHLLPGVGVAATVEEDGRSVGVAIGDPEGLLARRRELAAAQWEELSGQLKARSSARRVAVVVDGDLVAAAAVDEQLRQTWPEALKELSSLELEPLIMTGDRADRAEGFGVEHVHAGLSPEDKLAGVRELQSEGRVVLFVGDGVNDAAAMAASDISVAVSEGTELASEVADVRWAAHDARMLPEAVRIARQTVKTVRGNVLFAITYNAIGVSLAITGTLHPVAAALLMTCSSLVVTWRASALVRDGEPASTAAPAEPVASPAA